MDKEKIEKHIKEILILIGEDTNREGLRGTPERVARMYAEVFRGYDEKQKPKVTTFQNGADGLKIDEMIIDKGDLYSHCEHHMCMISARYFFAYIPNDVVLGLSKVARIVDYYSAKLQIQERLVKEIVDELQKICKPKGIALVVVGEHFCKTMRGVKKKGEMITSDLRGAFKENDATRAEFMKFVNGGN